jgi:alanine dehydrogenase
VTTGATLVLTRGDVQHFVSLTDCIAAVEHAFRMHGEEKTQAPGMMGIHSSEGGFHIKAGILQLAHNYFAAKVNANFPSNPQRFNLPTIQGVIVLCDAQNGCPLAVLDSMEITALRTAAATAVAVRYLARKDSKVVTICGCGAQGSVQLQAIAQVLKLERAFAYDIEDERASHFAREWSNKLGFPVQLTKDLTHATRQSDVCVTCTSSRQPFLRREHIRPGTFIAAVGADNPEKQELAPELMVGNKVVVDVLDQCAESGDLHHALRAGVVRRSDVHAELGKVVAGTKPGRALNDEIIVFDSTGMALQDVAVAAIVYEKAAQAGFERTVEFALQVEQKCSRGKARQNPLSKVRGLWEPRL